MKRRYLKSTLLDWLDTNADLLPIVVMIVVILGFGLFFTGWPG